MTTALSTGKFQKNLISSLCARVPPVAERGGPDGASNTNPALTSNANWSSVMASTLNMPGLYPAQSPEDPLIAQARFLNEAAALERRLAMRRALRNARSEAAVKGWDTRRAR